MSNITKHLKEIVIFRFLSKELATILKSTLLLVAFNTYYQLVNAQAPADSITDGQFDYGPYCEIGPTSPKGQVKTVTIKASAQKPVEVTVANCTYAIDNALKNETTGQYLAGADWETSPKVFNRDAPVPAPFIITQTTTLGL